MKCIYCMPKVFGDRPTMLGHVNLLHSIDNFVFIGQKYDLSLTEYDIMAT